jgi:hypothetical protein
MGVHNFPSHLNPHHLAMMNKLDHHRLMAAAALSNNHKFNRFQSSMPSSVCSSSSESSGQLKIKQESDNEPDTIENIHKRLNHEEGDEENNLSSSNNNNNDLNEEDDDYESIQREIRLDNMNVKSDNDDEDENDNNNNDEEDDTELNGNENGKKFIRRQSDSSIDCSLNDRDDEKPTTKNKISYQNYERSNKRQKTENSIQNQDEFAMFNIKNEFQNIHSMTSTSFSNSNNKSSRKCDISNIESLIDNANSSTPINSPSSFQKLITNSPIPPFLADAGHQENNLMMASLINNQNGNPKNIPPQLLWYFYALQQQQQQQQLNSKESDIERLMMMSQSTKPSSSSTPPPPLPPNRKTTFTSESSLSFRNVHRNQPYCVNQLSTRRSFKKNKVDFKTIKNNDENDEKEDVITEIEEDELDSNDKLPENVEKQDNEDQLENEKDKETLLDQNDENSSSSFSFLSTSSSKSGERSSSALSNANPFKKEEKLISSDVKESTLIENKENSS